MGPMGGRGKRAPLADINVTPLVDVMLVLLIIFMVTAPMMTQGVDIQLPETTAKPLKQTEKPIVVEVNAQGDIYLDRVKGNHKLLKQQLATLAQTGLDKAIFLRADKAVPYGIVVAVMADIKEAGFEKLGMITQPPEEKR